jgi:aldehyde:ferredoxin oxidoreductase
MCSIDNIQAIVKANAQCTNYGMDTIGAGVTIAFAMECFERGIITEKDTGGVKLNFGNADAMLQMLDLIIKRQGFGDVLAEGSERAAKKIGRGAEAYVMTVKGQEIPMHEPRFKAGLGIGYTISHTGADHCHNIHDSGFAVRAGPQMAAWGIFDPLPSAELSPAKVRMLYNMTLWQHLLDSMVFCQFVPLSADTNYYEQMKDAERYATMARLFNLREGMTKADDRLPKRFFTPFKAGPIAGSAPTEAQVQDCIETYYGMMGWDNNGVPTRAKLAELGIEWPKP